MPAGPPPTTRMSTSRVSRVATTDHHTIPRMPRRGLLVPVLAITATSCSAPAAPRGDSAPISLGAYTVLIGPDSLLCLDRTNPQVARAVKAWAAFTQEG